MKTTTVVLIATVVLLGSCTDRGKSSDSVQQQQQETMLAEATAQVGMPAIHNFRERKILKDIMELRDQDGLVTYTYLYNEMTGKAMFFCNSVGYGIPYATQFTNPQKIVYENQSGRNGYTYQVIAQADPNGLFSPASAEGTWVLCKDPNGKDVKSVYVEPRIIVAPFKLKDDDAPEVLPGK